MAEPTNAERGQSPGDLAAAARDRGMEQLESVKGQLAEGAERAASAVERTAEALENEGDETISGFGRSLSGLMRQLAGGLRERDVEQFASELTALARRNPAVFLAGSVALGFGAVRFLKARAPSRRMRGDSSLDGSGYGYRADRFDDDERSDDYESRYDYRAENAADRAWRSGGEAPVASRDDFDGEESLDLSGNPSGVERRDEDRTTISSSPSPAIDEERGTESGDSASTGANGDTLRGGKES